VVQVDIVAIIVVVIWFLQRLMMQHGLLSSWKRYKDTLLALEIDYFLEGLDDSAEVCLRIRVEKVFVGWLLRDQQLL